MGGGGRRRVASEVLAVGADSDELVGSAMRASRVKSLDGSNSVMSARGRGQLGEETGEQSTRPVPTSPVFSTVPLMSCRARHEFFLIPSRSLPIGGGGGRVDSFLMSVAR